MNTHNVRIQQCGYQNYVAHAAMVCSISVEVYREFGGKNPKTNGVYSIFVTVYVHTVSREFYWQSVVETNSNTSQEEDKNFLQLHYLLIY